MLSAPNYADFYLGQAHLKLENPAKAVPYFKAAARPDSGFEAEAHWYLALAYLKMDNPEEAKTELLELVTNFEYNVQKAQILLEAID